METTPEIDNFKIAHGEKTAEILVELEKVFQHLSAFSPQDFYKPISWFSSRFGQGQELTGSKYHEKSLLQLPEVFSDSYDIFKFYGNVLRFFAASGGRLDSQEFTHLALQCVNRRSDNCLCLRSLQTAYMWDFKFASWAEDDAYAAIRAGNAVLLEASLKVGFNPNCRKWGLTPLEMACSEKGYATSLVPILLAAGAMPNSFLVCPPLAINAHPADSVVKALVQAGADPNASGYFRQYGHPLLLVSLINKVALLENGAWGPSIHLHKSEVQGAEPNPIITRRPLRFHEPDAKRQAKAPTKDVSSCQREEMME